MFAACVTGQRERGFVEQPFRVIVVFDLNALVGVIADTVRLAQSVRPQGVLVP